MAIVTDFVRRVGKLRPLSGIKDLADYSSFAW
jgi:hypothetical protein